MAMNNELDFCKITSSFTLHSLTGIFIIEADAYQFSGLQMFCML